MPKDSVAFRQSRLLSTLAYGLVGREGPAGQSAGCYLSLTPHPPQLFCVAKDRLSRLGGFLHCCICISISAPVLRAVASGCNSSKHQDTSSDVIVRTRSSR